ncbi:tetratricopeptide repeat-containing sensor histidine kinase [Hyphobacterium sp. CCMP332]|nr:tetratricopeptide repeat-containing sensor histidine kinase [Hyphobacterium sp. CCMP332]
MYSKPLILFQILLFLILGHPIISQEYDSIEDLEKQLTEEISKKQRVDILNTLTFDYIFSNPQLAPKYNNEAIILATEIDYDIGESRAYNNKGIIYRNSGFYEEATLEHLKSLEINNNIDNLEGKALDYSNLGMVYLDQNNYVNSIKYFRRGLKIKEEINDSIGIVFTYNDLTSAYIGIKRFDSALYYSIKALSFSKETKQFSLVSQAKFNIANIHYLQYKIDVAAYELKEIEKECIENNNIYILSKVYNLLSEIKRVNRDFEAALIYAHKALQNAKKYSISTDINKAYMALYKSNALLGDYESAYNYLNIYNARLDSMHKQENEQKTVLLATQYEFAHKQKMLEEKFFEELSFQRIILTISISLIVFVLGIFLVSIWKNKKLKEANQRIEKIGKDIRIKNQEIQEQNDKIHMQADKLMKANAAKNQIFNIISHDLKSPLENLNMLMDLSKSDTISEEEFKDYIKKLGKKSETMLFTLNNLLTWSKSQMNGLYTNFNELKLLSFLDAERPFYKEIADSKNIDLNIECNNSIIVKVDQDQLRIVLRNLVNNAIKFTNQSGKIEIKAEENGDIVNISVSDNGVGIEPEDIDKLLNSEQFTTTYGTNGEKGTGIGLKLCKELIERNKGSLQIFSERGKGSVFKFSLNSSLN